jgi:hypothetical protein
MWVYNINTTSTILSGVLLYLLYLLCWRYILPLYTYSRTSIIRASINRACHWYAVHLHYQCMGGVVSG